MCRAILFGACLLVAACFIVWLDRWLDSGSAAVTIIVYSSVKNVMGSELSLPCCGQHDLRALGRIGSVCVAHGYRASFFKSEQGCREENHDCNDFLATLDEGETYHADDFLLDTAAFVMVTARNESVGVSVYTGKHYQVRIFFGGLVSATSTGKSVAGRQLHRDL